MLTVTSTAIDAVKVVTPKLIADSPRRILRNL